jgi:hypothetical protein
MPREETVSMNLRTRLRDAFSAESCWQTLTWAFCILFGLAMIANVQVADDGSWFWYAVLFHQGKLLYADLHLTLQPLIVLETNFFLVLLGKSWLAMKAPAVLHVLFYSFTLWLLARYSNLKDHERAIVLACAFFLCISFTAYRFDDYHVLADSLMTSSLVVLLMLSEKGVPQSLGRVAGLTALVGVLSGLTIMTRLPDGAALILGVAICVLFLAPVQKLLSLLVFLLSTALTVLFVLHLTGDSLHTYAMCSIFQAAGSKGGTSHILAYPLALPRDIYHWLKYPWSDALIGYTFGVGAVWAFLLRPAAATDRRERLIKAAIGLVLVLLPLHRMYRLFVEGDIIASLSTVGVLVLYIAVFLVIVRFVLRTFAPERVKDWDPREVLLIIPFGHLLASSMGSAGEHTGIYAPIGMMILLLAIASPVRVKRETTKSILLTALLLTACGAAINRARVPYMWHSYVSLPLFVDRRWYHHPVYGPMIIDSQVLGFIQPICQKIDEGGSENELLSTPYTYANYFCNIPPWQNYATTFFDTSTPETIFGLMDKLKQSPPKWILYQRQLDNLRLHENVFHKGQPIPHRFLDNLIEEKINDGEWQVVYTSDFGNRPKMSNEWILIRTRQ